MAMLSRALISCALTILLVLALSAPSAQARGLELGFLDPVLTDPPAEREPWLARAADSGAGFVRLNTSWASLAPTEPRAPTDPADAAYRWAALDSSVRAVQARGLDVIISLSAAPRWAVGANPPKDVNPAVWRPRGAPYGSFARALAKRYSGSYRDPAAPGATLPRVRTYLPWNEPNLTTHLAPQWTKQNGRFRPASPAIYRSLLNNFARGVKSVDARNRVVAGATAPFGDSARGGDRMPPVFFVKTLLRSRTVFDVLSHHPYSTRGPRAPAFNPGDVSVADMAKLRRPLRAAERRGRISPDGRKALWVTELSWDSSPPDPDGVPTRRHVRWIQDAMYVLWRGGVDRVTWFLIRDQAPTPSFGATYQSGIYFRDGRPKLAQRAYAFPFVLDRVSRGVARFWTRAPAAGTLVFERRGRGGWRTVSRTRVGRHQVVLRKLRAGPRAQFRARMGSVKSIPWRG